MAIVDSHHWFHGVDSYELGVGFLAIVMTPLFSNERVCTMEL